MARVPDLEQKIDAVKQQLLTLGDLQPGGLTQQYKTCGNPNCCCHATPPKKHGPYFQVSFTRNGKGGTKFVKAKHVATVRQQLKNYERMQKLLSRWVDLSTALCHARLAEKED